MPCLCADRCVELRRQQRMAVAELSGSEERQDVSVLSGAILRHHVYDQHQKNPDLLYVHPHHSVHPSLSSHPRLILATTRDTSKDPARSVPIYSRHAVITSLYRPCWH